MAVPNARQTTTPRIETQQVISRVISSLSPQGHNGAAREAAPELCRTKSTLPTEISSEVLQAEAHRRLVLMASAFVDFLLEAAAVAAKRGDHRPAVWALEQAGVAQRLTDNPGPSGPSIQIGIALPGLGSAPGAYSLTLPSDAQRKSLHGQVLDATTSASQATSPTLKPRRRGRPPGGGRSGGSSPGGPTPAPVVD